MRGRALAPEGTMHPHRWRLNRGLPAAEACVSAGHCPGPTKRPCCNTAPRASLYPRVCCVSRARVPRDALRRRGGGRRSAAQRKHRHRRTGWAARRGGNSLVECAAADRHGGRHCRAMGWMGGCGGGGPRTQPVGRSRCSSAPSRGATPHPPVSLTHTSSQKPELSSAEQRC